MKLTVGIIGLGRIGHLFGISPDGDPLCHSEAYAQIDQIELRWGIDPDLNRRASFSARFPGAVTFADSAEMMPAQATDIVSVCGPTAMHAAGVDVGLKAGARVIVCEKPLAPTVSEARAIVDRCHAAGCILVVNYIRRFSPMLEQLRRETAPGGLLDGTVKGCIRYGGGFMHSGTHWIDLCQAMFGNVMAARALSVAGDTGEDVPRTAEFTCAGDRTVVLLGVTGMTYSIGEGEFLGRDGAVRFAADGANLTTAASVDSLTWPGYRTLGIERVLTKEGLRGHFTELARHAAALASQGGTPRCTGEDGVSALRAAEMALGTTS